MQHVNVGLATNLRHASCESTLMVPRYVTQHVSAWQLIYVAHYVEVRLANSQLLRHEKHVSAHLRLSTLAILLFARHMMLDYVFSHLFINMYCGFFMKISNQGSAEREEQRRCLHQCLQTRLQMCRV